MSDIVPAWAPHFQVQTTKMFLLCLVVLHISFNERDLFQVCVVYPPEQTQSAQCLQTGVFSVLILITTLCLRAKRKNFFVTKANSEVPIQKLIYKGIL